MAGLYVQKEDLRGGLEVAQRVFADLDALHWTEGKGVFRPGYSTQSQELSEQIAQETARLGMTRHVDLAGNVYSVFKGKDSSLPAILVGSHSDAVSNGGRYDGAAGIVAGLAAIEAINGKGLTPERDIVLVEWQSEESPWFAQYGVGSKLATGALGAEFLNRTRKDTGQTLAAHMTQLGLDPDRLSDALKVGQRVLPVGRIAFSMEGHVEQNNVLDKSGSSIGLVTAMRGNLRPGKILFHGRAGHSGAVPQEERQDAVFAMMAAGTDWKRAMVQYGQAQEGSDVVLTAPKASSPITVIDGQQVLLHNTTTIPDWSQLFVELRSTNPETLERGRSKLLAAIWLAADENNCRFDINEAGIILEQPAQMSRKLNGLAEAVCTLSHIRCMPLISGAGHDSGVLSHAGVDAFAYFWRHNGVSHHWSESLDVPGVDPFSQGSNFAKGIRMMANMMFVDHGSRKHGLPFDQALLTCDM